MNITDIRRQNLERWVAIHGVPQKERSLFSQLKGEGSFGEKVARRLEQDYRMGNGYLDLVVVDEAHHASLPIQEDLKPEPPVAAPKLQWITEEEYEILSKYRGATLEGQISLRRLAFRLPQAVKVNGVAAAD